jgi:LysR family glycine cleavage system transcriptional activator
LNVTPAALSFQIKSLEEHLGGQVFRRMNRAVELTEAGRALFPGAQDGFQALAAAWRSAQRVGDTTTLSITAGPAFTAKWLAPRMFGFAQAHPEIELRFSATLRIMDFDRDGIDAAIRFGYGPDAGFFTARIADDWMTPMMTPELARRYPTPAALATAPLLTDGSVAFLDPPCDWPAWFRANGLPPVEPHGPQFNQGDHAIDAALTGVGVILGRGPLAEKAVREGRLVAPFEIALTTEAYFRFVCPEGTETRPQVAAFLDWLRSEAATVADLAAQHCLVPAADVPA